MFVISKEWEVAFAVDQYFQNSHQPPKTELSASDFESPCALFPHPETQTLLVL